MPEDEAVAYFGSKQSARGLILFSVGLFALIVGCMALALGIAESDFAIPTYGIITWSIVSIWLGLRMKGRELPSWLWWLSHFWLATVFGTFAYIRLAG